jgi:hypothetical protein
MFYGMSVVVNWHARVTDGDLVRSGRAEEVMMPILRRDYGISAWSKKFNYLPIGSIEISNSGNSLTEYPDEVNE